MKEEYIVLGGLLSDSVVSLLDQVKPQFFEDSFNKRVFNTLKSFYIKTGKHFDKQSLMLHFEEENFEEKANLDLIVDDLDDSRSLSYYTLAVEKLKEKYRKRSIRKLVDNASESLTTTESANVLSEIRRNVADLESETVSHSKPLESGSQEFDEAFDRALNPKKYEGIKLETGVPQIDKRLKYLNKKQMITFVAPTGNGKTTMLVHYVHHLVTVLGKNVMWFVGEDNSYKYVHLLATLHGNKYFDNDATRSQIQSGDLNTDQKKKLQQVQDDLKNNPKYGKFIIQEIGNLNVLDMMGRAEHINKTVPIDVMVVDYPSCIPPLSPDKGEREAHNETYRLLERFARTFNNDQGVLMVCAHQVNRAGKKAVESDGTISDYHITDNAAVENTSHVVIGITKAERVKNYTKKNLTKNDLVLSFIKARDGIPGGTEVVRVHFEYCRIVTKEFDYDVHSGGSIDLHSNVTGDEFDDGFDDF